MIDTVLPDPATPFGRRVAKRLRHEQVIWMTTVGADGTPQPNPVWFLKEDDGLLVYSRADAHRLRHIRHRPRVSLHFDGNGRGGDIVVIHGRAAVIDDVLPPDRNAAYLEKYAAGIRRVSGGAEAFAVAYPVPIRIEVTRVRGF